MNINNPCDSSHHSRPVPHLFTSFLTYSFHYQGTTHLSEMVRELVGYKGDGLQFSRGDHGLDGYLERWG